jgi:hypothetical protein
MIGNEMARERIADRLREAEAERRSRSFVDARAAGRRRRLHAAISAVRAVVTPQARRRIRTVDG